MSQGLAGAELGCAAVLALVVVTLTGLASFSLGRIGDLGTLRYAWPWLSLFFAGGAVPTLALMTAARRSRNAVIALTLWMLVALFASVGLAINSGGGI